MTSIPLHANQDTLPGILDYIRETVAILWKDWPTDMNVTAIDKKNHNFTLNGTCPHCNRLSVFIEVTNKHIEIDKNHFITSSSVMLCQGCVRPILAILRYFGTGDNASYVAHYPLGAANETLDPNIPQDVAEDFKEAIRCEWVKSYRACVVMCRRALQTSVMALNAKGKGLVEQIEDLAARGVITTPLKEFAHEIRLTGNAGAHPDGLGEVKGPDAEAIMEFTREYLDHVYVMPAKLKARRPAKTI